MAYVYCSVAYVQFESAMFQTNITPIGFVGWRQGRSAVPPLTGEQAGFRSCLGAAGLPPGRPLGGRGSTLPGRVPGGDQSPAAFRAKPPNLEDAAIMRAGADRPARAPDSLA